jgi:hypothetical protein
LQSIAENNPSEGAVTRGKEEYRFARLVDRIVVKSRDTVLFILKDGSEVKADLSAAE